MASRFIRRNFSAHMLSRFLFAASAFVVLRSIQSRYRPWFFVFLVAPWGFSVPASGAPEVALLGPLALKTMSVAELMQQKVISVSRHPEEWGDTATSLFVLTGDSPRISGATRLPELLRLAPNLFVAQSSSSHWGINARGFMRTNAFANKLLVMIDGRSVYSPFFSNVFWDSQSVFLPDLDRIEVISGPSGATWGSNAVNGVVNIVTKSAHETQGGILYAGLGTDDENHGGARYGGKFGETGAYRVYVQRMEYGSTLAADGTDDNLDPWHFSQAGFRTDWGRPGEGRFTVQGDIFTGHYRVGDVLPEAKTRGANVLARWSRELANGSEIWVRLYHDYYNRDTGPFIAHTTHTTDLEFQHRFAIGRGQEFLWGANYRYIDDHIGETLGFVILPENLHYDLASVFGQHQIRFAEETLRLTSGLRIEDNHFSGLEALPSLRLAWRPIAGHTFWAAASRATRIPDRLDTGFHAPSEEPYFVIGGPDFSSEVLLAYELGWRMRPLPNLSITTILFHHDYDELRSVEPTNPVTIANGVEGLSHGVELFVDWDVTDWWRLRLGGFYVYQDTWLESAGGDFEGGRGEISFPSFQAHLRSSFKLNDSTMLWLGFRHVDEVPGYDQGQSGTVPAYTELDASLNWRVRAGLELSITGRNLLDRAHPEIGLPGSWRQIERSVQVMARYGF